MDLRLKKKILFKNLAKYEKIINKANNKDISSPELKNFKNSVTKQETYIKIGEKTIWNELIVKYEDIMKENLPKMIKWISEYISKHSPELSCRGPSKPLMFNINNEADLIATSGFDVKDIKAALKKSKYIKPNWEVANKPLNMILSMYIFYFYLNKKKFNYNEKSLQKNPFFIFTLMMTVRFYSSLQKRQFKHGADEELMTYTISQLSNRFLLKDMENMFELVIYLSETNIINMEKTLSYPIDYNLWYFMINLYNRLSSLIKSIGEEYYKNYEDQIKVSNDDINKTNDEGKKYVDIPSNISTDIAVLSRKLRLKMITDTKADQTCLALACKQTKYSKNKMEACLDKIREEDDELMLILIVDALSYYLGSLKNEKRSIKSSKFLSVMKRAFSTSNSKDPFIIDMKETLDKILDKYSEDFKKTNRAAQISIIRATLYLYVILYIGKYCE